MGQQYDKQFFQRVYEAKAWYGDSGRGRCPATRLLPHYLPYLKSPILDMGCGRGDLVFKLRKMGYECDGIDFVDLDNGMFVGSILEPIVRNYKTMVCIDVLEHIEVGLEHLVFENFQKSEGQIFSVHNGPAMHGGKDIHINKKSFSEWGQRVGQFLSIDKIIKIHQHQQLFITHAKKQKTRR